MDAAADLDHFGADLGDLAVDVGGRLFIDGGFGGETEKCGEEEREDADESLTPP